MSYEIDRLIGKHNELTCDGILIALGAGPIAVSLIFDVYFDWGWYALFLWLIFSGLTHIGQAKKEYQAELDFLEKLYGSKSSS